MSYSRIVVFGEVLFDCFPTGEQILGGAPFNVAWHLQALGAQPCFVSAVGDDERGRQILAAMQGWDMRTDAVQLNNEHPTGVVEVQIVDGQPAYQIREQVAYDYLCPELLPDLNDGFILYHGTLALRHEQSRRAFDVLANRKGCALFVDVNLRAPWWSKDEVLEYLQRARWAKMNADELAALGFNHSDLAEAMAALTTQASLEQLIVTCGAEGVLVSTRGGELFAVPALPIKRYIDTVGAGDAFSAVYLQGLMTGRSIEENIGMAQQLAADIIGQRGAIPGDRAFYNTLTMTG